MSQNFIGLSNFSNPWDTEDLDQFQFYVCPECDVEKRIKDSFRKHVLEKHPRSREFHQSSSCYVSPKKSSKSPAKNQNDIKKSQNTILVTTLPLNIESPIQFVTPEKDLSNPWDVDDLDKFLKYVCPECGDKKPTKPNFRKHALEKHPKSREFHQTSECYVFPKQPSQKQVEDKDETTYFFDGSKYYKTQSQAKNDPNAKNSKLRCEFCDKFFSSLDNLEKHIVNFHGVKSIVHENQNEDEIENSEKPVYLCDECDFETYDLSELPDHKQKMHRTCKHCGLCFKRQDRDNKRRYRAHVKWCVNAIICSYCDKRFRHFDKLRV